MKTFFKKFIFYKIIYYFLILRIYFKNNHNHKAFEDKFKDYPTLEDLSVLLYTY